LIEVFLIVVADDGVKTTTCCTLGSRENEDGDAAIEAGKPIKDTFTG
jgi:hypothetical protein